MLLKLSDHTGHNKSQHMMHTFITQDAVTKFVAKCDCIHDSGCDMYMRVAQHVTLSTANMRNKSEMHMNADRLTLSFLNISSSNESAELSAPIDHAADLHSNAISASCGINILMHTGGYASPELWPARKRFLWDGSIGMVAF